MAGNDEAAIHLPLENAEALANKVNPTQQLGRVPKVDGWSSTVADSIALLGVDQLLIRVVTSNHSIW